MSTQINNKNEAIIRMRKVLFPLAIITVALANVWLIIHILGLANTVAELRENMTKAGRFIAMPVCFLSLVMSFLMIAYSILQFIQLNKTNVKTELTSAIINVVVGILLFVSFIIIVTSVFDNDKWILTSESANIWKNSSFLGMISALSIYVIVMTKVFRSKQLQTRDSNAKTLRTIGYTTFVLSLCALLPLLFTCIGGFYSEAKIDSEEIYRLNWLAASIAAKYAIAAFGVIAFGILFMIPLSILSFKGNTQKQNLIQWSVLGGIAFVLFVIVAAMMTLDHGLPKMWIVDDGKPKNIVISVFMVITGIYSIVVGSIADKKTKILFGKAGLETPKDIIKKA